MITRTDTRARAQARAPHPSTSLGACLVAAALVAAAGSVAPIDTVGAQAAQNPGTLSPSPDEPPTRQGTRGANFLQIGVGARENAMAGAVNSVVTGPTSWYWNPAGAAAVQGFSASASRQNMYTNLDITMNFVGLAIPLGGGVLGAHFTSLNSGDIERTTTLNPYGDNAVGLTYEWTASAVGVGYARQITDRLDVGLGVKMVTEGLTDASTTWGAVDIGTQFRTGLFGTTLGASVMNVGPASRASGQLISQTINTDRVNNQRTRVYLRTQETELPTMFRFSAGTEIVGGSNALLGALGGQHVLRTDVSVNDAIDQSSQLAVGAEYAFRDMVFVRGGKRFYNDDRANGAQGSYGLAGGLGLRLPIAGRALRFDYGYVSLGDLDNVQVFSFEIGR
jgi:hypothetical protein